MTNPLEKVDLRAIYAQDITGGIGVFNKIPWTIKEDLVRFKELTTGCVVVMGRRTWESLPEHYRPLPKRENVVVSSTLSKKDLPSDVRLFHPTSLIEQIEKEYASTKIKVWVIGGAKLLKELLPYCNTVERTIIYGFYSCDTYVDPLDLTQWSITETRHVVTNTAAKNVIDFETLQRIKV
jgi:dihydrofolate reductase